MGKRKKMKMIDRIKKRNAVIFILLSIILIFIGLYLYERLTYRKLFWEIAGEYQMCSSYKSFRSGEDLIYYGLPKDEVMKMLPEPLHDGVIKLDSSMVSPNLWWYYHYFARTYLKSKYDTIEVNVLEFRIPYHEIPNLYLGLIKRDSIWVVERGVQWNDETQINSDYW